MNILGLEGESPQSTTSNLGGSVEDYSQSYNSKTNAQDSVLTCSFRLCDNMPYKPVHRLAKDGLLPCVTCTSIDSVAYLKGGQRRRLDDSPTNYAEINSLHVDTRMKLQVPIAEGRKYWFAMVEEYSCFLRVQTVSSRAEASEVLRRFLKFFANRIGRTFNKGHVHGDGSSTMWHIF